MSKEIPKQEQKGKVLKENVLTCAPAPYGYGFGEGLGDFCSADLPADHPADDHYNCWGKLERRGAGPASQNLESFPQNPLWTAGHGTVGTQTENHSLNSLRS